MGIKYQNLFKTLLINALTVFLILFSAVSTASDLYNSVAVVNDYGKESRLSSIKSSLNQLLVRVSTNKDVLNHADLAKNIKNIDEYVNKFVYKKQGDNLFLHISFNSSKVNELLNTIGFEAVNKQRPVIMAWLSSGVEGKPSIVGYDDIDVKNLLVSKSQELGIPLIFPLYDLEDQALIQAEDIVNFDLNKIQQSAKRYNPDALLVGSQFSYDGDLNFKWTLLQNNKQDKFTWISSSKDWDTEVDKLMEKLLKYTIKEEKPLTENHFSEDFNGLTEVVNADNFTLKIAVSGINSLDKYSALEKYLKTSEGISDFELLELNSDSAVFNLKTNVEKSSVLESFRSEEFLVENKHPFDFRTDVIRYKLD